jgi:predicted amidohydrolase
MFRTWIVIAAAAAAAGTGTPEGWRSWSPRSEIAPRFSVDSKGGRRGGPALRIDGGQTAASYGAWQRRIDGIAPGKNYRLTAWYRARGIAQERRSVGVRLEWLDERGRRARPPDYALDAGREQGWVRIEHNAQAPPNARSVVIGLSLGWAAGGTVWWDGVDLAEAAPRDRAVRVATVYHRPSGTKSAAESVEQFCRLIEGAGIERPDIVCLPEGITVIGTGKSYADVSEAVPGPTTARLGATARKLHSYIVAGVYERAGAAVYNTAVLVDREGRVAGKYRKTHLPYEEAEAGLTPGDAYPVFATDFGKVGMLVCWDAQFPEPARALALAGAELILLPIWGGNEVLVKARAIENHVYLATSSYDMKTFIVDPTGAVLAEAGTQRPVASIEVHLDRKLLQPWLGDMKARTWKERRPDITVR